MNKKIKIMKNHLPISVCILSLFLIKGSISICNSQTSSNQTSNSVIDSFRKIVDKNCDTPNSYNIDTFEKIDIDFNNDGLKDICIALTPKKLEYSDRKEENVPWVGLFLGINPIASEKNSFIFKEFSHNSPTISAFTLQKKGNLIETTQSVGSFPATTKNQALIKFFDGEFHVIEEVSENGGAKKKMINRINYLKSKGEKVLIHRKRHQLDTPKKIVNEFTLFSAGSGIKHEFGRNNIVYNKGEYEGNDDLSFKVYEIENDNGKLLFKSLVKDNKKVPSEKGDLIFSDHLEIWLNFNPRSLRRSESWPKGLIQIIIPSKKLKKQKIVAYHEKQKTFLNSISYNVNNLNSGFKYEIGLSLKEIYEEIGMEGGFNQEKIGFSVFASDSDSNKKEQLLIGSSSYKYGNSFYLGMLFLNERGKKFPLFQNWNP